MDAATADHGWTHAEQRAFLAELGRSGIVANAAAAANRTARSAYQFRLKPAAQHFRRNWAAAAEAMYANLLQLALTRVAEGTPADIVRGGIVTGQKLVFDNRLLTFLLAHLKSDAPAATGAARADPHDRLHAGLDALEAAIGGVPLEAVAWPDDPAADAPLDPADLPQPSTPAEHEDSRAERITRAHLRLDDYQEQQRDRAACTAEGRHWVPRAFKPLPPLRWYLPPDDDLTEAQRYHRFKRRIAAMHRATTDEEKDAAAKLP